ncbi:hypothetical protein B0A49_03587 [Cryomyces minteri]|uniref:Uncharacterized protein n=1 Tax=Cryomyces minteri TaxID=331657 RepID=A0A4U0XJJ7_9PEZI|nr:hypothetical protein B0A49_03587 [Cryomyces minteri]
MTLSGNRFIANWTSVVTLTSPTAYLSVDAIIPRDGCHNFGAGGPMPGAVIPVEPGDLKSGIASFPGISEPWQMSSVASVIAFGGNSDFLGIGWQTRSFAKVTSTAIVSVNLADLGRPPPIVSYYFGQAGHACINGYAGALAKGFPCDTIFDGLHTPMIQLGSAARNMYSAWSTCYLDFGWDPPIALTAERSLETPTASTTQVTAVSDVSSPPRSSDASPSSTPRLNTATVTATRSSALVPTIVLETAAQSVPNVPSAFPTGAQTGAESSALLQPSTLTSSGGGATSYNGASSASSGADVASILASLLGGTTPASVEQESHSSRFHEPTTPQSQQSLISQTQQPVAVQALQSAATQMQQSPTKQEDQPALPKSSSQGSTLPQSQRLVTATTAPGGQDIATGLSSLGRVVIAGTTYEPGDTLVINGMPASAAQSDISDSTLPVDLTTVVGSQSIATAFFASGIFVIAGSTYRSGDTLVVNSASASVARSGVHSTFLPINPALPTSVSVAQSAVGGSTLPVDPAQPASPKVGSARPAISGQILSVASDGIVLGSSGEAQTTILFVEVTATVPAGATGISSMPTSVVQNGVHPNTFSFDPTFDLATAAEYKDCSVKIEHCEHVASYNWLSGADSTILVPGKPPAWTPLETPRQLTPDSGNYFKDPNAARFPTYPTSPAVRAIFTEQPHFPTQAVDIFACGRTMGNLLAFVRSDDFPFRLYVEVTGNMDFFVRKERSPAELIEGVLGYGHTFREAYTSWEPEVGGSASHQLMTYSLLAIPAAHFFDNWESDNVLGRFATLIRKIVDFARDTDGAKLEICRAQTDVLEIRKQAGHGYDTLPPQLKER